MNRGGRYPACDPIGLKTGKVGKAYHSAVLNITKRGVTFAPVPRRAMRKPAKGKPHLLYQLVGHGGVSFRR